MEDRCLDFAAGGGPVAYGLSVLENDRPEDAVAAMNSMNMVWVKCDVATLVTNQVFVIGRKEVNAAAPESSGS